MDNKSIVLFLLLMMALIPTTVSARVHFAYKGQVRSSEAYCQHFSKQESPLVEKVCIKKIIVNYNLSLLMGEPVERYHVYWEIDPNLYLREGVTLDGKKDKSNFLFPDIVSIDTQTPAVQKAFAALIPIYPTRFVIEAYASGTISNQSVYFAFDGGDLSLSGKGYSYNTPGSPNWNKFLLADNYYKFYKASQPLPYILATQAKDLYQYLDGTFRFSSVLNLTFGVSGLNEALRGELIYPFTVNVKGPGGSHIAILNIKPSYKAGMMLKAGRYHIRVTHSGFKPVQKWIWLNAKHQNFSIQLVKAKIKKKKTTQKVKEDSAAAADELGSMLDQTETPHDSKHDDNNPFADDTPSSKTDTTSTDVLDGMLDQVGRQDTKELQQTQAKIHSNDLRPIKKKYKASINQCNSGKPILSLRPCSGLHLTEYYRGKSPCEKQHSTEWCEKKSEEEYQRECAKENVEWERREATFPQRLEAWKRENKQCLTEALTDYKEAVKNLQRTEQNIDDFASDIY